MSISGVYMASGIRKTVLFLVAIIAILLGLTVYKYVDKLLLSPQQLSSKGVVVFDPPREIKLGELIKHNNKPLTQADFKGQWSLIYFGYTFCPDICPTSLRVMSQLDTKLRNDSPDLAAKMGYMMITVDPKRDTASKLSQYVPYFSPDFVGVTGSIKDIYEITRQFNIAFTPVVDSEDEFYFLDHSAHLVIVNPQGDYHGFIRAPLEPKKLELVMRSVDSLYE